MIYTQDISRGFADVIGKDGAEKAVFARISKEAEKAVNALREKKLSGSLPVLGSIEGADDLKIIEEEAARIRAEFATLVVVGMGGSSRGGKTLAALKKNDFALSSQGTKVHFIDNIDPATSLQMLAALDLKSTLFLIISKSGNTAETIAHMLVMLEAVSTKLGKEAVKKHFLVITEPKDSPLKQLARTRDIRVLGHDPGIGGRFSAMTVVGLLPAKVAGVDIRELRKGAAEILAHTFATASSEPARGAAMALALLERGKTLSVMMPYSDPLDEFTAWYKQIWAESLGKKGKGMTPIRALGASDQHSQLQLYLDGPRDKFITLFLLAQADKGPAIPSPGDASLAYLSGHTLGDLMDAEQRATAETLTRAKIPVRLFTLPRLDEQALGALMMHFMIETMIVAECWHINAFDQPAVEESKQLARSYLMQRK